MKTLLSNRRITRAAIACATLILAGAGMAFWLNQSSPDENADSATSRPLVKPIFLDLEPFTTNLQAPPGTPQYLQAFITLQLADQSQVGLFNRHMPQARSRVLLLLAAKRASELASPEDKSRLAEEIRARLNQAFQAQGAPQKVDAVHITSLIIQ